MTVAAIDREQRLAETFVELADTLVADFDVIDFLQVVAGRCVELLDVAASGLVLADAGGSLVTVAASDERARLLELFEIQNDEGPCRDCYRLAEAVVNVDLDGALEALAAVRPAGDRRRVRLGQRAAVAAAQPGHRALNLFHSRPGGLGSEQLRLAQALADAATIGILQQRTIRHGEVVAGQLQAALTSRVVIEQAKGVLAERLQISTDDAFTVLRGGGSLPQPAAVRTRRRGRQQFRVRRCHAPAWPGGRVIRRGRISA